MASVAPVSLLSLRAAVHAQHGFLTAEQVATLASHPEGRLTPILVRCGASRFTAPAQDVARLVKGVTMSGDYVRDCSLPVGVVIGGGR